MKSLRIQTLMRSVGRKKFLAEYWAKNLPIISHGSLDRLTALKRITELASVRNLSSVWNDSVPIMAWPPKNIKLLPMQVRASEALNLYDKKFTLYFHHVERALPALQPLIRSLEHDLGLLPGEIHCEAFASHAGSGARPHFDRTSTFNLQLKGSKFWELARNRQIADPSESFTIGGPSRMKYLKAPMPTRMPRAEIAEEVHPGSVVYVPRGVWHRTEARSESFALLFTVNPRSWGQVLMSFLTDRLVAIPSSRELALSLGLEKKQAEGRHHVENVIAELKNILKGISANEVVDSAVGCMNHRFRIAAGVGLKLSYDARSKSEILIIRRGKKREAQELDKDWSDLVRTFLRRKKGDFSVYTLSGLLDLPPEPIFRKLTAFVSLGILEEL